jgi:hypothetical protein
LLRRSSSQLRVGLSVVSFIPLGLHKRMPLPSLAQIQQITNNGICSLIGGIMSLRNCK